MTSPKKLKILICLLYYLPHRTGMQLYIQRISEAFVAHGHEVTVLCVRHQPDLPSQEMVNGVKVIRLWSPPIPISRGMIMPAYPYSAFKHIRNADVVSVHTPMLETALIGFLARILGRKVIITHHGDLLLPKGLSNRIIQGTMFFFYRLLAMQAPRLVAYTQDYADHSYYLRPFLDKVKVIHPPITMPAPNPDNAQKLRAEWSPDGAPIIGYAGRFVQEKRPDLLIQSLEIINKKYPNARIVFAGEYNIPYENTWEMYQHVVEKYRDQLIFLGLHKDMQFMADFFRACDVLALTSDSECFALVQVEAMLSGTPVVMTDTPGGRVPVTKTGMGALTPVGDYVKIGETIVRVLDNRENFMRSRDEIETVFSFEETVAQYEAVFEEFAR
jgi:glycosyltransferase involved in cell wall biosynthesis